jgi:hypothetical protein
VRISAAPKLTTKGGGERSILRSPPCLSLSGPDRSPHGPDPPQSQEGIAMKVKTKVKAGAHIAKDG